MSKAISENLQVHISVAFLVKAMVFVALGVGAFYQIQMRFDSLERTSTENHAELLIVQQKMHDLEKQHIEELEHHNLELIEENRTLMQRLGLKKP